MKEPQIYCPHCHWRPGAESRWLCSPTQRGCGAVWNTFWTGGICPGCSHRWQQTQCLACTRHSLHAHWYHFPDEEARREVQEEAAHHD